MQKTVPLRFVSTTRSQSSSVISRNGFVWAMPATLTRMSMRPNSPRPCVHHGLNLGRTADIHRVCLCPAAQGLNLPGRRLGRLAIDLRHDDIRPFACQAQRDGFANPLARTRDNRHFARQSLTPYPRSPSITACPPNDTSAKLGHVTEEIGRSCSWYSR